MYSLQPPLDPPCDDWHDRDKPVFINMTIQDICADIARRGAKCANPEVFDYLYEYIEDNIEKFLPDPW